MQTHDPKLESRKPYHSPYLESHPQYAQITAGISLPIGVNVFDEDNEE
jgi:hypothetical protein